MVPEVGLPEALGQCFGQPGELKNHSPDGFSLASLRRSLRAPLPLIAHIKNRPSGSVFYMVPEVGLEPTRYRYQRILSPPRLPIPSFRLTDVILTYVVAFCNGVFPRALFPVAPFCMTLAAAIVYQKILAYYTYKLCIARLNSIAPPHYIP